MIHDFIPELLAEGRILGHMHNPYILENRRRLIGRADLILVNSESTRRDLLARYPTVGDRVRVTLLGSGLPAAPRVTPGVVAPFLLWVGRRAAYKNFARTLEAFARLRADGLRLVCVGGGPFEEGELAQLARLGLDGRVELRSAGDAELAGLYRDASGLVYTSQYEGFGLPVLEALGQGCPVLCASTSSLPEVGGAAALYCNPDDTEALREGLGLLLRQGRSEADCARRREQASPFTWERCFRTANAAYALLD
jgi:glycosyltransferase involved in cell wall biosynthesis